MSSAASGHHIWHARELSSLVFVGWSYTYSTLSAIFIKLCSNLKVLTSLVFCSWSGDSASEHGSQLSGGDTAGDTPAAAACCYGVARVRARQKPADREASETASACAGSPGMARYCYMLRSLILKTCPMHSYEHE